MGDFLRAETAAGRRYLPGGENVLRAFRAPFDEVRVLTGPTLTAMNTAADTWLTAIQTAELQMVILHDENVPGTTTPSLVTSLTVDPTAGTQRRRMRF